MVNDFILLDFLICLQDVCLEQHMLFISFRSCPTFYQCTGPKNGRESANEISSKLSLAFAFVSHPICQLRPLFPSPSGLMGGSHCYTHSIRYLASKGQLRHGNISDYLNRRVESQKQFNLMDMFRRTNVKLLLSQVI